MKNMGKDNMLFKLLPKEVILGSFFCKHKKNLTGNLHITNIRCCWVPEDNSDGTSAKSGQIDIAMSDINIKKDI